MISQPAVPGTDWRLWWIVAALAAGVALAGLWLHTAARFENQPIVAESPAAPAKSIHDGINVNDQEILQQRFTVNDWTISHLAVGLANFRGAPPDAVVTVRVTDNQNYVTATASARVADFPPDDMLLLPMSMRFAASHGYVVSLATDGIAPGRDVTVFYENESSDGLTDSAQKVRKTNPQDVIKALPGRIGFQLMRLPTRNTILTSVAASWLWWAAVVYLLLVLAVGIYKPWRQRVFTWIGPRLSLPRQPIDWRDVLLAVLVASAMAIFVTLPLYKDTNRVSTIGDVQRALIYRGVAREAVMQHQTQALWEPYLCGGGPLLGNPESAQLDPFFLSVVALGEQQGLRVTVTLGLIVSCVGATLLARRFFHADRVSALLAGLLFSFSGFQLLSWSSGYFAWLPIAWMPWAVLFWLESLCSPRWVWLAAFTTAFIFLGSSVHMTLFTLAILAFVAMWLAVAYCQLRPLIMLALLVMLMVNITAIKLLPMASTHLLFDSFERPPTFIPPLTWFPTMFLDRSQLSIAPWQTDFGELVHWREYGAYVGVLPFLLFVVGVLFAAKRPLTKALVASCLLIVPLMYGLFPWSWLHNLPLLHEILRTPQRLRAVFLLIIGLLAAYGLAHLTQRLRPVVKGAWLIPIVALAIVAADLATFHTALFGQVYTAQAPSLTREPIFARVAHSYTDEPNGLYRAGYLNYVANQGTTDVCMPYVRGSAVRARNGSTEGRPYRGEAWVEPAGTATLASVQANEFHVALDTPTSGWLYLNQQFFPGWRTEPAREVRKKDGVVAARVQPGDRMVRFIYDPVSYRVGRMVTVITLALLVWHGFTVWQRRATPKKQAAGVFIDTLR